MTLSSLSSHAGNPQQHLLAAFERIAATRMAGLPVINPALAVAVPNMRAWRGDWVGVLVTPWAINLVVLPGAGGKFQPLEFGACQQWAFPSGDYEFLGLHEDGLGYFQSCSLMSPVFEFPAQDAAEAFALAALQGLLEKAPEGLNSSESLYQLGQAQAADGAVSAAPVSRRGFLLGRRT